MKYKFFHESCWGGNNKYGGIGCLLLIAAEDGKNSRWLTHNKGVPILLVRDVPDVKSATGQWGEISFEKALEILQDYAPAMTTSFLAYVLFKEKPVEVKLNEEYTAIVALDKKSIKVGCQTIPAAKVLEIAALLK